MEEAYDSSQAGFVTNTESSPVIPSSEEIGQAAEQFLAAQSTSPLDRVVKEKRPPKYTDDLRRIGRGLRRGRHHFPRNENGSVSGSDASETHDGEPDEA